ncbi:MAG TPA: MarR family winged helix-turn-helix transcriptional regulator [Miltoncostaeaceae bacterium]|nr:MarR family winged helix-turn-helix transcriptional regulator [Miltoncostaeaceae bacterium]
MSPEGNNDAPGVVNELLMTGLELGQVLERELRDRVGLGVSQFNVLRVVAGREGGTAHAVDLIRVLGMSSAHATTVLQQLEERGLVARRESTTDRRRRAVTVTHQGRAVLASTRPLLADLDARLGEALGPGDGAAFRAHLRQMRLSLRHGLSAREWDDCVGP